MATPFVHLHNHTEYSLLDGAQRIPHLVKRAKELEMPAVAMTDHGNMFGAVRFYQQAMEQGVKPILGCELYLAPGSRFDRSTGTGAKSKPYYHMLLLAETNAGFSNLIKLVSYGYLEGFYYRPRVDRELLNRYSEGIICLSGCLSAEIPIHLRRDAFDDAKAVLADYQEIFGEKNVYLEMQDQGIDIEKKVNEGVLELHKQTGVPLVATNDCHFLKKEDHGAHDVLICIGTGKKRDDPGRMQYSTEHYFKSGDEMLERFSHVPEALANTLEIADRCDVKMDFGGLHLPAFPTDKGETLADAFRKRVREGFDERRKAWKTGDEAPAHPLSDYEERLERELDTIVEMGFEGYFLITWDFIRHAREVGVPVGPGRGSAAGSLVAYCLWITDIDPLEYDLLFERFLNPERVTMPDIDIDFCFRRRQEVIDYVTEKYGRENVAQIITFGTLAAKAAIRDSGRVLSMSYADVDRIAKLVPDEIGTKLENAIRDVPKLQAMHKEDPAGRELLDVALTLEGMSRHASTHAAGVVITPKPVMEYAPLFKSNRNEITTQWAKDEVEAVGLLKMDFLGLKTLTLIQDALELIELDEKSVPDLDDLGLEDEKTYELFTRGDTSGVFQFESSGMRDILRRLKPEKFEDLIALNALYRPGPLGSGMIEDFIQRRHGKVEVSYPHELTEKILAETYGVIVYQEQVMQIASAMGGYSLGQADLLRRAMGKKKVEVMEAERARFREGAKEREIDPNDAESIFNLMAHFAGYGFNKSHSAAYALVAYRTAYLKAHYPVHFMAALLTNEKDNTDKLVEYINECRQNGIDVLPPEINNSGRYFQVEGESIRFGLAAVKGVGEGAVDALLDARKRVTRFGSLTKACCEIDRKALNRRTFEAMIKSGAMDEFGDRAALFAGLEAALESGARAAEERAAGQSSLFGGADEEEESTSVPLPETTPWPDRERLAGEKEALGFYFSGHPLDDRKDQLEQVTSHAIAQLEGQMGTVAVGGLITALKRRRTRAGDWMATFVLEDTSGQSEVVIFPKLYRVVGEGLEEDKAVVVKARADSSEGDVRLMAESVVPLEKAEPQRITALTVRLSEVSSTWLDRLSEVLADHPGPSPLYFEVVRPGEYHVVLQAEQARSVQANKTLLGELQRLLGPDGARLGRPKSPYDSRS